MRERLPKCPLCKSDFHYKHVDLAVPFRCPVCDQWLRAAHSYWYSASAILAAMIISGFICYGLGARGANLFLYAILLWLPVFFVVIGWKMHFAPPSLKPSSSPLDTKTLRLNG
jgi:hypothetical protein